MCNVTYIFFIFTKPICIETHFSITIEEKFSLRKFSILT